MTAYAAMFSARTGELIETVEPVQIPASKIRQLNTQLCKTGLIGEFTWLETNCDGCRIHLAEESLAEE